MLSEIHLDAFDRERRGEKHDPIFQVWKMAELPYLPRVGETVQIDDSDCFDVWATNMKIDSTKSPAAGVAVVNLQYYSWDLRADLASFLQSEWKEY